jgi:hypothetical protein
LIEEKRVKRVEVMLEWRDAAAEAGHAVPEVADMMRIGAAGYLWPPDINLDLALPWKATITFLLKQLQLGVPNPLAQLPDGLRVPATPEAGPGSPTTPPTSRDEHPVLAALLEWRKTEQPGNPSLDSLKDTYLRSIVTSNSRSETEIRRHLPGDLRIFAPRIAEVVARCTSPAPAPPEPARSSETEPGAELTELKLADYDYATPLSPKPLPVGTRLVRGGIELSWPGFDSGRATVLYRVVSADSYRPDNPQRADEVRRTTSLSCIDDRGFATPVRHVQVWCHVGASAVDAAKAEPVLHAQTAIVAPVRDAVVEADGGAVFGQWSVPAGVQAVRILRIPAPLAGQGGGLEHRILADRDTRRGFEDREAQPGIPYVYRVSVEARSMARRGSRNRWSSPSRFTVSSPR